jgi:hypothetical protein
MSNFGLIRIVCVGLLPAATVALSMFVGHNIFVAMFVMHWTAMILAPLALVYFLHGKYEIQWYFDYIKQQQFFSDWRLCVPLLLLGVLIPVLGYMADSCRTMSWHFCVGQVDENLAKYGFEDASKALIIACAVYFPIVNPLIEELFWRVFMDREYTVCVGLSSIETMEDESSQLVERGEYPQNDIKSTKSDSIPISIKLLFSSLYSSYHTMVVGVFLGGVQFGILAFFCIAALGYVFQYIFSVSDPKRGFSRAVAFHAGIDTGVVIALGDAVGWYSIIPR